MQQRLPSHLDPPVAFAHRGARAHAPENTIESFELALRLGATGLESDVWLTADGHPVLDHAGTVRVGLRRRPLGQLGVDQLPPTIATLEDLYTTCGADFELSIDLKDVGAAPAVVAVARAASPGAEARLWLCHPDWEVLRELRGAAGQARLVNSTRLRHLREGPERRAATLADAGIDAVNLHHTDWTGGLTTLFHRFGRLTLGWDAQFERTLDNLLDAGIDGVYSDHVDRMMAAVARLEA
jgi:glycerophosphoryl diester phosphodiesterase